ncbi:MAG: hemerythrin domain-containing protein [Acidobacteriota bacterium]
MQPTTDALELLTSQHAVIDDLFDFVATLRDPDALSELAAVLTSHLAVEQELVYASLSPPLPAEVLEELHAEHREIERTLAELVWLGVGDEGFDARLARLGALLDGHVLYQEDHLFPTAASAMSIAQLAELGGRIASARPICYTRTLPLAS